MGSNAKFVSTLPLLELLLLALFDNSGSLFYSQLIANIGPLALQHSNETGFRQVQGISFIYTYKCVQLFLV